MDNIDDFYLLVEEMRRAQKAYARSYSDLDRSVKNRLENEVDALIKRHKKERKEKGEQASLFN